MAGRSADQRLLAAQENLRSAGATQIAQRGFPHYLPVIFNASSNVLSLQRCWTSHCRGPFAMPGYDIISSRSSSARLRRSRASAMFIWVGSLSRAANFSTASKTMSEERINRMR